MDGGKKIHWKPPTVVEIDEREEYRFRWHGPRVHRRTKGDMSAPTKLKGVLKKGKRETPRMTDESYRSSAQSSSKSKEPRSGPSNAAAASNDIQPGLPRHSTNVKSASTRHNGSSADVVPQRTKKDTTTADTPGTLPWRSQASSSAEHNRVLSHHHSNSLHEQSFVARERERREKEATQPHSRTVHHEEQSLPAPAEEHNVVHQKTIHNEVVERERPHNAPRRNEQQARRVRQRPTVEAVSLEEPAVVPTLAYPVLTSSEKEKEAKRQANAETYQRIYLLHKEKLTELKDKLKWMDMKQLSKKTRIEFMGDRSCLSFQERVKLANLKHSSKRLRAKMIHTHNKILHRRKILGQIQELQKQSLKNPNPMEENPTISDYHPARFGLPTEKCWVENEPQHSNSTVKSSSNQDAHVHTALQIQNVKNQLARTLQEADTLREKREVESQRQEEAEKEKRRENAKAYYQIYLVQREKVNELKEKLKWMQSKRQSKQNRIEAMEKEGNLKFDVKIHLRSLKNSLKKLEKDIANTRAELTHRRDTIRKIAELQKKSLSNPNPMAENPSLADFEPDMSSGRETHSASAAPMLSPAVPKAPVSVEEPAERPPTRSLLQRLNPKTMVASLQKKLSKKPKPSRPLGAHHSRVRSRTENMQEVIPYEMEQYDSDSDEEETSSTWAQVPSTQDLHSNSHHRDDRRHVRQQDDLELLAMCEDTGTPTLEEASHEDELSPSSTMTERCEAVASSSSPPVLEDDWLYPVESETELEPPKISLRLPAKQTASTPQNVLKTDCTTAHSEGLPEPGSTMTDSQPAKLRTQLEGKKAQNAAKLTAALDRLLKAESELEQNREPTTSSSLPTTQPPRRDTYTKISTSQLVDMMLEADLDNCPELIDWFVNLVKYASKQRELVRRLVKQVWNLRLLTSTR